MDEHASKYVGHSRSRSLPPTFHRSESSNQVKSKSNYHCMFQLTLHLHPCISEFKRKRNDLNICANAFLSFMPPGILCYLPMNVVQYGRVPFYQGTGYIHPHRVTNQSKAHSITNTIHVKRCVHLNNLLYTPNNCMIVFQVVGRCRRDKKCDASSKLANITTHFPEYIQSA